MRSAALPVNCSAGHGRNGSSGTSAVLGGYSAQPGSDADDVVAVGVTWGNVSMTVMTPRKADGYDLWGARAV